MTSIYILLGLLAVLAFFIGYSFGIHHVPADGYILLDKNEDGDDRITFQLGMEYDDLAYHKNIIFKVVKK